MHPVLADRGLLGLHLLGYLPIGIVLIVGFGQHGMWGTAAAFFLPLTMVYAFVGLSAYYVCLAFPLGRSYQIWRALLAQFTAVAIAGALGVGIAWVWSQALQSLNLGLEPQQYLRQPSLLFVVAALMFWIAIAFHYVLIASYASQRSEKRALESEILAREAELKALRAQLDPHFLFNSLNSISSLTTSDPASARRMCLLLADFLRETLRLGPTDRISLRDELSIAQRYLAIEQVRLGARLAISYAVSEEALDTIIPPLILQPLVENAVLHGIAPLLAGGTISISGEVERSSLLIRVINPCDPDRSRGRRAGLGLMLVRQRLQSQYGAAGQLQVREQHDEYVAQVSIPLE